jgi:hypothetical protein
MKEMEIPLGMNGSEKTAQVAGKGANKGTHA